MLPPVDPDFLCDITSIKVGKRALFLLTSTKGGFRIMHFGRGALPLVDTSLDFDWPGDFVQTRDLREVCHPTPESRRSQCDLEGVRALIAKFGVTPKNSALVFAEGEPTIVVPAGEVSCAENSHAWRGLFARCTLGGADAGPSPPPLDGLLECWKDRLCIGEARSPGRH